MSIAGRVNIAMSLAIGAFAALMAYVLESELWWLWGAMFSLFACMAIAACQIASVYDSSTPESRC